MIKIFNDAIGLSNFPSDISNGVGKINDNNDLLTEELNGIYEGEFELLQSDPHYTDLHVGSYIEIPTVNGSQIFKVYYISKAINGVSTVRYCHVTYDLSKTVVSPFTATGAVNTKNGMLSHTMGNTPFTMTTDITNTTSNFSLDIPRSFRECLGGYEGSILDVFRPEYEWDNLTVKMLAHRGSDNGVRIAYGKNLTDFKQEENIENVYTSVLGYAVVDDVTYLGTIYDKIITSYPKVKIVDFSSDYESGEVPTQAELTTKAQTYATNNDIEIPNVNLTISFVPLYQTEEYKNIAPLERVQLGDTVHVFFEKLGVEASARVIKTVWNVNLQRYDSIELGNAKANLNTVINETVDQSVGNAMKEYEFDTGYIENELNELGDLILNGMGLFVTKNVLIDGSTRIVLHNKQNLADSNIQYYIGASGLVVSTDYGQTWNAGFQPDGSATLNSLSANIIKALQIYGSVISGTIMNFGNLDGNYVTAKTNTSNNGVVFEGTGEVDIQTQGRFYVNNIDNSSNTSNSLEITGANYLDQIQIINRNPTTHNKANAITFQAYSPSGLNQHSLKVSNYNLGSETLANELNMVTTSSGRTVEIANYDSTGGILSEVRLTNDEISITKYYKNGDVYSTRANIYISSDGNIFMNGNGVYFNGTQKW